MMLKEQNRKGDLRKECDSSVKFIWYASLSETWLGLIHIVFVITVREPVDALKEIFTDMLVLGKSRLLHTVAKPAIYYSVEITDRFKATQCPFSTKYIMHDEVERKKKLNQDASKDHADLKTNTTKVYTVIKHICRL